MRMSPNLGVGVGEGLVVVFPITLGGNYHAGKSVPVKQSWYKSTKNYSFVFFTEHTCILYGASSKIIEIAHIFASLSNRF